MSRRYLISLSFVAGLVLTSAALLVGALADVDVAFYFVLAGLILTVIGMVAAIIEHSKPNKHGKNPSAKQETVLQILLEVLFWLP